MKLAKSRSFTLLEILIVIIIIGILAALMLPRFIDVLHRSRGAEAIHTLHLIRDSQIRYKLDHATPTILFADLDVDNPMPDEPNDFDTKYFYYTMVGTTWDTWFARATYKKGDLTVKRTIELDLDGDWSGTWRWLPGPGPD